jgi:hypothetical protein
VFGLDLEIIGGGIAALLILVASWVRRGRKLKRIKDALKSEAAKDEILDDMERSVPQSFHIDRLLAKRTSDTKTDGDDGS